MVMKNPFVTNGYAGPEYFCDRMEETQHITEMLTNENNMALISPRRIGKTELIHHCFAQPAIQKDYYTFIIDIYSTNSVSDLVNMFGKAIIDKLRPKGIGNMVNPEITLDEIFAYLNQADKPCLVAIDEFQQITNYADNRIEALLRTYIQRCTNAHFIFSGSHRHLMAEMFTSPARPFYQSVTLMNLKPLDIEKYKEFATAKFEERNKQFFPQRGVFPSTVFMIAILKYVFKFGCKGNKNIEIIRSILQKKGCNPSFRGLQPFIPYYYI